MFDVQTFSKELKIALSEYLAEGKADPDLAVSELHALKSLDLFSLKTDAARLAFWINLYNAITNYQIIHFGLKESVWELPDFFKRRDVEIGDFQFSLDDIEHGILRQNGPRRNGKPRQFLETDERLSLMLKKPEPRIHFALNCGSISCPPIAFYSEENIDEQLQWAEANFVRSEFVVDHASKRIRCSEIFDWYWADFGIRFLNDPDLSQYTVEFRPYIWKFR